MRATPSPIARIAEDAGVAALTRASAARAPARSSARSNTTTIAAVKRAVAIPVIANGDIDYAGACAPQVACTPAPTRVMIGRARAGPALIFREIAHFLATVQHLPPPTVAEARALIVAHLADHYAFYGEAAGVRIARKHLAGTPRRWRAARELRREANAAHHGRANNLAAVERFFDASSLAKASDLCYAAKTAGHTPTPRAWRRITTQRTVTAGLGRPSQREAEKSDSTAATRSAAASSGRSTNISAAGRRDADRHLRHGDRPRGARVARIGAWTARAATRRRRRTCWA